MAVERGLGRPGALGTAPVPCAGECAGRLVLADLPGGPGPVATLRTEFATDSVSFEAATRFLDPVNWARCSDFWCAMRKRSVSAEGVHRYHEVVSTNCAQRESAWTVEAELDFTFRAVRGVVAIAEYQLADGHPAEGDDVLVDEGSLVVRRVDAGAPTLNITTTKRIKFNRAFGGEALAMIMCQMGYADFVRELFFRCAACEGAHEHQDALPWQAVV